MAITPFKVIQVESPSETSY